MPTCVCPTCGTGHVVAVVDTSSQLYQLYSHRDWVPNPTPLRFPSWGPYYIFASDQSSRRLSMSNNTATERFVPPGLEAIPVFRPWAPSSSRAHPAFNRRQWARGAKRLGRPRFGYYRNVSKRYFTRRAWAGAVRTWMARMRTHKVWLGCLLTAVSRFLRNIDAIPFDINWVTPEFW